LDGPLDGTGTCFDRGAGNVLAELPPDRTAKNLCAKLHRTAVQRNRRNLGLDAFWPPPRTLFLAGNVPLSPSSWFHLSVKNGYFYRGAASSLLDQFFRPFLLSFVHGCANMLVTFTVPKMAILL